MTDRTLTSWNKAKEINGIKIREHFMHPPFVGHRLLHVECPSDSGALNFCFLYKFNTNAKRQVLNAGNDWKYVSGKTKKAINSAIAEFFKI